MCNPTVVPSVVHLWHGRKHESVDGTSDPIVSLLNVWRGLHGFFLGHYCTPKFIPPLSWSIKLSIFVEWQSYILQFPDLLQCKYMIYIILQLK